MKAVCTQRICATCKHCDTYGRNGHHICRAHNIVFRGLQPAFYTCEDWEPI